MLRLLMVIVALVGARAAAGAQVADPLATHADWRTLDTRHFRVHYPAALADWTLPVAARLDSVHAAVAMLVGYAPDRRTTVVVTDPYNVSNGFALPFQRTPTMVLWPTPPEPRSGIGEHRDWGELLAVHEYAHLAHLTWPSRNRRDRLLWSVLPVQLSPVTRRSPRWVIEGYATYVEGRLTGTGRPHGTWRPTILRQWALEGRLPTYGQLSAWDAFQGGAMAYMVGSAFLEWLVAREGEESLTHLWRRMTAVQRRGFADAFAGVYGAPPDELYGRFTVEVMREALTAEALLGDAGLVEGERFQRLSWATGDPAVSPDGSRMAIVLRSRGRPARVVLWSTDPPGPLVSDEDRERLLERDPEDVPAVDWRPRPKEPLATLQPVAGRGHDAPRFMPDGRRLLVTRAEPLRDGRLRHDLFVWDSDGGGLQRITRGAGVRHADPAPNGLHAAAVRCLSGRCDLVHVDLRDGRARVLHAGAPDTVFYRPRYSPGGDAIAVAVQAGGRWRIALTDEAGAPLRYVDPDDGHSRFDADWVPGEPALVVASTRGGVVNLERIDLETGEVRTLTRTTGAAVAPAPSPQDGSIFFLRLHSRGFDLNRLATDDAAPVPPIELGPGLARVAPVPAPAPVDTFPTEPLSAPRAYGAGPQSVRALPGGAWTADGAVATLGLHGTDPIGRLAWGLTGAVGEPGVWRGAGLEAVWRGSRPAVRGALWAAGQRVSARDDAVPAATALTVLDADYAGAALWTELEQVGSQARHRLIAGGSLGWIRREGEPRQPRRFVIAEASSALRFGDRPFMRPSFWLHGSAGQTAGGDWQRTAGGLGLRVGRGSLGAAGRVAYATTSAGADGFEATTVGGTDPLVFPGFLLPQRIPLEFLPTATFPARRLLLLQASATFAGVEPIFWAMRDDDTGGGWYRLLGAHRSFHIGPAPLARLPELRIDAGAGYPLDEPNRHRFRVFVVVDFRP